MFEITNETELDLSGISIVRFWAIWSIPCKPMFSLLKNLSEEFKDDANFYSVNIDNCMDIAKKYKIEFVPTIIFFEGQNEGTRIIGGSLIKPIRTIIKKMLKETYGRR